MRRPLHMFGNFCTVGGQASDAGSCRVRAHAPPAFADEGPGCEMPRRGESVGEIVWLRDQSLNRGCGLRILLDTPCA